MVAQLPPEPNFDDSMLTLLEIYRRSRAGVDRLGEALRTPIEETFIGDDLYCLLDVVVELAGLTDDTEVVLDLAGVMEHAVAYARRKKADLKVVRSSFWEELWGRLDRGDAHEDVVAWLHRAAVGLEDGD